MNLIPKDFMDLRTPDDIRNFITVVEEKAMAMPGQISIEPKHHFSKDIYAREIEIPKDSVVIGKIHKHSNLNILSKGSMLLVSIDGIMEVHAPYTIVSKPGVKRLALALEDCVWTTIHGTSETDVSKIEEEFIAKTYDDVPKIEGE